MKIISMDRYRIKGPKTNTPWLYHQVLMLPRLYLATDQHGQAIHIGTIAEMLGKTVSGVRGQVDVLKKAKPHLFRNKKRRKVVIEPRSYSERVFVSSICRRYGFKVV